MQLTTYSPLLTAAGQAGTMASMVSGACCLELGYLSNLANSRSFDPQLLHLWVEGQVSVGYLED